MSEDQKSDKQLERAPDEPESCVEGLSRKEFLARLAARAAVAGAIVTGVHYTVFKPAPANADATVAPI